MKKFLSVLIPVILLTATVGVYVLNHYCMITGKAATNYSCCSRCNEECCKKDLKVIRLTFESVKQSDSKILAVFEYIPFLTSGIYLPAADILPPAGAVSKVSVFSGFPETLRNTILRI